MYYQQRLTSFSKRDKIRILPIRYFVVLIFRLFHSSIFGAEIEVVHHSEKHSIQESAKTGTHDRFKSEAAVDEPSPQVKNPLLSSIIRERMLSDDPATETSRFFPTDTLVPIIFFEGDPNPFFMDDTVRVLIKVEAIPDLFGYNVQLEFDPSQIVYLTCTRGTFLGKKDSLQTLFLSRSMNEHSLLVAEACLRTEPLQCANGNGVLFKVKYVAKKSNTLQNVLRVLKADLVAPDAHTLYPVAIRSNVSVVVNGTKTPQNHQILQNYPNPFNAGTRIIFTLFHSALVRLCVFDLSGCLVNELYTGFLAPGEHEKLWAGNDWSGRPVASGQYFVSLHMDDMVLTRKLLLLR